MTALVPVEGNPFAQPEQSTAGLVPVEGNPFDTTDHRAMQDRIDHGNVASRMLANMASSAKEGFGSEHVGFEPGSEAEQFWKSAGLLKDNDAIVGPLVRGGVAAGDLFMRAIKGAVFTGAGAVEQIVKENGGDPHHLKYELADAAMFAMNAAPMAKPTGLARVRKLEDGTVRAERIGEMAKPEDFPAAAEMLRESAGPEAKTPIEPKLRSLYEENGIHPSEVLADAAQDPTLAKRLAADDPLLPPEYTGVDPVALKAEQATMAPETMREMPGVSPELSQTLARRMTWPETPNVNETAPAVKPRSLGAHIGGLLDRIGLGDVTRDLQMKITPMAARNATIEARATAKDWANSMRVVEFDKETLLKQLDKEFTPERRQAIFEAIDAEGVALRSGQKAPGMPGLSAPEKAVANQLVSRMEAAWNEAKLVGIIGEEAKGLDFYAPRIFAGATKAGESGFEVLDAKGRNIVRSSAQLNRRKYLTLEETEAAGKKALGEEAFIVRDIKAYAVAEANLMKAVAGRRLINQIEEIGRQTGEKLVHEGTAPEGTFTIPEHPSFYKSVPRPGEKGVFDRVPIHVDRTWEGPLRAIMQGEDGAVYQALMDLKAKSMNYIMFSPMTHNMVIYGRAAPEAAKAPVASGLGVNWYVQGNKIRTAQPELYRDFVQNGMAPIARGFVEDINAIAGEKLGPQYSIEARLLGKIPDLFNPKAGTAVKASVDKMGDVLHNTLLWDRIADMQVGMAKFQYDQLIKDGFEHGAAMKMASHLANRFAGALPMEEMSGMARKISNVAWFSRSFTLGNVGAMKDMFVGLPRSVLAQIERDHGIQQLNAIQSKAQRKAIGIVAVDMALFYAGVSLIQTAVNAMKDMPDEGYVARFQETLKHAAQSPFEAINPGFWWHGISATGKNEPDKQDRVLWGYDSQGTAQYMRNPFGKVSEDQIGWMLHPMKMLDNKLSPIVKPIKEIQANQNGIGKHVYNPYADTPQEYVANATKAIWHFMSAQVPSDTLATAWELISDKNLTPDQQRLDTLKLVGQLSGFTFSQGAQGGPAMGELFRGRAEQKYAIEQNLPEIKKAIKEGRMDEASAKMREVKMAPGLQKFMIQTTLDPSAGMARKAMQQLLSDLPEEQRQRVQYQLERSSKK